MTYHLRNEIEHDIDNIRIRQRHFRRSCSNSGIGDNINSFGNGDTSDQFNAAGDPFKAAGDGEARRGGGRRVYVEATSREIDRSNVPDLGADTAWLAIEKAGNERDLDDFREVSGQQ